MKVLLLGTGESGKSTVMKQMRIIYGDDYTADELESFKLTIQHNCVDFMQAMCKAVAGFFPGDEVLKTPEFLAVAPESGTGGHYRTFPDWSEEYVNAMRTLWAHQTFKATFERRSEFQLQEGIQKFIERLPEIADDAFVPSKDDVLACRLRTRGINEERLNVDGQIFCFFDVGGQRNERRKWLRIFEDVHAVVFIVALSEFNQTLWEANDVNRISEALNVFEEYVNKDEFEDSAIILFLNKSDLFREKIKSIDLKETHGYRDYTGKPFDYDDGVEYFKNKFLRRNLTRDNVFVHVTTATDTNSVNVVFNACKKVILERNVRNFIS